MKTKRSKSFHQFAWDDLIDRLTRTEARLDGRPVAEIRKETVAITRGEWLDGVVELGKTMLTQQAREEKAADAEFAQKLRKSASGARGIAAFRDQLRELHPEWLREVVEIPAAVARLGTVKRGES
jgi:hypothetical protein